MARSAGWMRTLDLEVGAPMVAALGALRARRPLPDRPQRVAILQPTAIGDAILSSGVVAHVAERYRDARVVVFHGPSNGAAIAMIDAQFEQQKVNFARPWRVVTALQAFKPDLTIDLAPWPRATALAARLTGGVTVGFDSEGQRRAGAFDVPVPHSCERHEFENFAAMAALLGQEAPYRMSLKRGWPVPAEAWKGIVLCHTQAGGSRAADRAWPAGHWAALARSCAAEGLKVGFTGLAQDEASIGAILADAGAPAEAVFSLAGRVSLPELAGLIEHCAALVSVDTGVLHLGGALGAPVIGLHGPSHSQRWGAWSARAIGLDSPYPGAGFTKFGFEPADQGAAMMAAITVERVMGAIRQQIGRATSAA